MKQDYFLLMLFCYQLFFSQIINFPDANFKARLLQSNSSNGIANDLSGNLTKIDQNNDGEIDVAEAQNISVIAINQSPGLLDYVTLLNYNITSLEGINYFTNLKILECKNNNLTFLDFKNLVNLEQVYSHSNKITKFLNFEDVSKLSIINCSNNLLTNLDFSKASKNLNNYNEVFYHYNNNPLVNLNMQCGKRTIWTMITDVSLCPFYGSLGLNNTCEHRPQPILLWLILKQIVMK